MSGARWRLHRARAGGCDLGRLQGRIDEQGRAVDDTGNERRDYERLVPDLSDPATLGCLLALVREVRRAPLGQVSPGLPHGAAWYWYDNLDHDGADAGGPTEAAALVTALRGAA